MQGIVLCLISIVAACLASEDSCSIDGCHSEQHAQPLNEECTPASLPLRSYRPKGPLDDDADAISYNPALTLEVFLAGPSGAFERDGFERAVRSLRIQGIPFTVISSANALLKALSSKKDDKNAVIMFLSKPEEIIAADDLLEILHKFEDAQANVVFGASEFCVTLCSLEWPRAKFFNAPQFGTGVHFIGYATVVAAMLEMLPPAMGKDPAPAHHRLLSFFLDNGSRSSFGLTLDYAGNIFQDLAGASDDINDEEFELDFSYRGLPDTKLYSRKFGTSPSIIRAGGNRKLLNQIGNYLPLAWTPQAGCVRCNESKLCISEKSPDVEFPSLLVSINIPGRSPFLKLILEDFARQVYPKAKMSLYIHVENETSSMYDRNNNITQAWLSEHEYGSVTFDGSSPMQSRIVAIEQAIERKVDYFLTFDSLIHLTNNKTLVHLLQQNRTVIAPMVSRTGKLWSNFWGASLGDLESTCRDRISTCGDWASKGECEANIEYMSTHCPLSCSLCTPVREPWQIDYKRSFDYQAIVNHERVGVWSVPYAFGAVLVKQDILSSVLVHMKNVTNAPNASWPTSTVFAHSIRKLGAHVFVSNLEYFGNVIDDTGYPISKTNPDLYMIENNLPEWTKTYIHPQYTIWPTLGMANDSIDGHLCNDIYSFPLFTDQYCDEFIAEAEASNAWSSGDNKDQRLLGGYEPVPTRDIHFAQLGYKAAFRELLLQFIKPIAEHHYTGYHMYANENLDFIVKYTAEGQAYLRPHSDASSVTIVSALNQRGVDFEGGGTHFVRQNCTVFSQRGWTSLHPGRITHQHEGLQTTKGTRYILVSFIDQ